MSRDYWDCELSLTPSALQFHNVKNITSPYDDNNVDITLFVSCYNEEVFIENTLNTIVEAMKLIGKSYEILIIDDCSKDNSLVLVKKFIEEHPEINIILKANKKNKGLAQNFIDGAFIGKGKYYRLICGDNSEPIETLVKVIGMMGEADIIVPYYIEAQGKSNFRQFVSKTYTKLINLISGNKINYYNGLQVHLRYNIMRWHPTTRGFGFQAALLCGLMDLGFSYKQVPCVTIEQRGGGGNAITWKNLRSVMHTMLMVLIRRIAPWQNQKQKES